MASLFMVATPVGNLGDMTTRAVDVLRSVALVVCEDTRHSGVLLAHFSITTRRVSAHSHNEAERVASVVRTLDSGSDVAYVSDAGTPGLSDPGRLLVRGARDAGHRVVPVPGASAFSALVSVNGFPGKSVTFEGFLSPKSGRRRNRLKELLDRDETFVLYESPHRLVKLLADLADLDPGRPVLLGRELTKLHEELVEGSASEVMEIMAGRLSIKGECALLVGPPKKG